MYNERKSNIYYEYKLSNMYDILGINTKTYYKYRNTEDSDYIDYLMIKKVFDDNKKCIDIEE